MSVSGLGPHTDAGNRRWRGAMSLGLAVWALAGCAPPPPPHVSYSHGHEHFSQSKYGHASRKVVADGQAVPHGGGQYLVGRPYTVAGRRYYPAENLSFSSKFPHKHSRGGKHHRREDAQRIDVQFCIRGDFRQNRCVVLDDQSAHCIGIPLKIVQTTNQRSGFPGQQFSFVAPGHDLFSRTRPVNHI